jgi:hypothetical protein
MVSADLSAAKRFRRDLPKEEVGNMFGTRSQCNDR